MAESRKPLPSGRGAVTAGGFLIPGAGPKGEVTPRLSDLVPRAALGGVGKMIS